MFQRRLCIASLLTNFYVLIGCEVFSLQDLVGGDDANSCVTIPMFLTWGWSVPSCLLCVHGIKVVKDLNVDVVASPCDLFHVLLSWGWNILPCLLCAHVIKVQ